MEQLLDRFVKAKCVMDAADTVMKGVVVAIEVFTVSLAVMVCVPAWISVAVKVPTPADSVELGTGRNVAPASVLVKCTVPVYPLAVLPNRSSATTLTEKFCPAVALLGTANTNVEALAALTTIGLLVPLIVELAESVALILSVPDPSKVAWNVPTPAVSVLLVDDKVV